MFEAIGNAVKGAVNTVKNKVSNAVDSLKGTKGTKKTSKTSSKKDAKVGNELNGSTKTKAAKEANKSTAQKLYSDINARNSLGLPTTGDDIGKHIGEITPQNVYKVLREYKKQSGGVSLIAAICKEVGLSADERCEYLTHIKNQIVKCAQKAGTNVDDISKELDEQIKYQKNKIGVMDGKDIITNIDRIATRIKTSNHGNYRANGELDKDFKQGKTGDCWVLAGLDSITHDPKALEQLNKQISVDKNGNVTVELRGVGKTYTISRKELLSATELSSGDLDARAVEIAVNKYRIDAKGRNIKGGHTSDFYDMMFGSGTKQKMTARNLDDVQRNDSIASCGNLKKDTYAYNENGKKVPLVDHHAYSISRITNDTVYLVNPWDTSETLHLSKNNFVNSFGSLYVLDNNYA